MPNTTKGLTLAFIILDKEGTHGEQVFTQDNTETPLSYSTPLISTLGHSPHPSEAGQAEVVSLRSASSMVEAVPQQLQHKAGVWSALDILGHRPWGSTAQVPAL